jgi:predicted RNA binding protein YcfA (HicA-like mRNA interferase family)
MGRLSGFRYREVAYRLKKFGFRFFREAKGSHEIWFNKERNRYTTIPKHGGDMIEGTLYNILKQAGIDVDDFIKI